MMDSENWDPGKLRKLTEDQLRHLVAAPKLKHWQREAARKQLATVVRKNGEAREDRREAREAESLEIAKQANAKADRANRLSLAAMVVAVLLGAASLVASLILA